MQMSNPGISGGSMSGRTTISKLCLSHLGGPPTGPWSVTTVGAREAARRADGDAAHPAFDRHSRKNTAASR